MVTKVERLRLNFWLDKGGIDCWYWGLDGDGNEVGVASMWSVLFGYLDELPREEAREFGSRPRAFLSACASLHGLQPLELEVQGRVGRIGSQIARVHYDGRDEKLMLEVS